MIGFPDKTIKQEIKGGLGDKSKLSDFNAKELASGIKVEREHTTDKSQATEIATDHLTEIPDYYTRLEKMENEAMDKYATAAFAKAVKAKNFNLAKMLSKEEALVSNIKRTYNTKSITKGLKKIDDKKLTKTAGGPGSGVQGDNSSLIPGYKITPDITIMKRKYFMDHNTPFFKNKVIKIDDIKYIGQQKFVPKKLKKFIQAIKDGETWPFDKAIDVTINKDGKYAVLDGHHRFLAAIVSGKNSIKANVYLLEKPKKFEKNAATRLKKIIRSVLPKYNANSVQSGSELRQGANKVRKRLGLGKLSKKESDLYAPFDHQLNMDNYTSYLVKPSVKDNLKNNPNFFSQASRESHVHKVHDGVLREIELPKPNAKVDALFSKKVREGKRAQYLANKSKGTTLEKNSHYLGLPSNFEKNAKDMSYAKAQEIEWYSPGLIAGIKSMLPGSTPKYTEDQIHEADLRHYYETEFGKKEWKKQLVDELKNNYGQMSINSKATQDFARDKYMSKNSHYLGLPSNFEKTAIALPMMLKNLPQTLGNLTSKEGLKGAGKGLYNMAFGGKTLGGKWDPMYGVKALGRSKQQYTSGPMKGMYKYDDAGEHIIDMSKKRNWGNYIKDEFHGASRTRADLAAKQYAKKQGVTVGQYLKNATPAQQQHLQKINKMSVGDFMKHDKGLAANYYGRNVLQKGLTVGFPAYTAKQVMTGELNNNDPNSSKLGNTLGGAAEAAGWALTGPLGMAGALAGVTGVSALAKGVGNKISKPQAPMQMQMRRPVNPQMEALRYANNNYVPNEISAPINQGLSYL